MAAGQRYASNLLTTSRDVERREITGVLKDGSGTVEMFARVRGRLSNFVVARNPDTDSRPRQSQSATTPVTSSPRISEAARCTARMIGW
jgi:hypothetical protein